MAPDLLPRVFDVFWQGARSADRREGGLGVGLAIVRHLMQQHGGTVQAESPGPGQGSTLTVSLPLAGATDGTPVAAPVAAAPPAEPSRVLLVDDNRDGADTLAEVLRHAGHAVEATYDVADALQAARALRPHVAILDIGLPVMDGYELAQRLRDELGDQAPIMVAVTGYGQPHDVGAFSVRSFASTASWPPPPGRPVASRRAGGAGRNPRDRAPAAWAYRLMVVFRVWHARRLPLRSIEPRRTRRAR